MTNLVTSPEASMFEKPIAADITTGKKLTKAANATCDSLLIPSHTINKKQGCERNFRNQLEYDEVTVITNRIDQQK
jgi:hypothetical protein